MFHPGVQLDSAGLVGALEVAAKAAVHSSQEVVPHSMAAAALVKKPSAEGGQARTAYLLLVINIHSIYLKSFVHLPSTSNDIKSHHPPMKQFELQVSFVSCASCHYPCQPNQNGTAQGDDRTRRGGARMFCKATLC